MVRHPSAPPIPPCAVSAVRFWHRPRYIRSHCRPCPRCMTPIAKNKGCNHIVCDKSKGGCGYEFCWACMQEWSMHGTSWFVSKKQ